MNFPKFSALETLAKVKSLAIEICSIPSIFYITGVKAYNRMSISQIRVPIVQYSFSSSITQNLIFTDKTDKYDICRVPVWSSLLEFN